MFYDDFGNIFQLGYVVLLKVGCEIIWLIYYV